MHKTRGEGHPPLDWGGQQEMTQRRTKTRWCPKSNSHIKLFASTPKSIRQSTGKFFPQTANHIPVTEQRSVSWRSASPCASLFVLISGVTIALVVDSVAAFARGAASTAWRVAVVKDFVLVSPLGAIMWSTRRFSLPLVPSLPL